MQWTSLLSDDGDGDGAGHTHANMGGGGGGDASKVAVAISGKWKFNLDGDGVALLDGCVTSYQGQGGMGVILKVVPRCLTRRY